MEKTTEQKYVGNFDEVFPIIDPSELIGHKLLKHKPKTKWQKDLLNDIRRAISMELPAFRVSCMDPSFLNGKIVFRAGNWPAIGRTAIWWDETWKKFMPNKNSRSGTELHYAVFLGKLMKFLIEEKNYSVDDAWYAVCNDSRELGHYWFSKNSKDTFESTGSRKIGAFFDLANTAKILKRWDSYGFLIASGSWKDYSYPLAGLRDVDEPRFIGYVDSVGWLVMDV